MKPRYPVFIPSKGRADRLLTAKLFTRDEVPFKIVVEPNEVPAYARHWGEESLLVLPENNKGLVYSRNWIKRHSTALGHERHWQFDDDIKRMIRLHKGARLKCPTGTALAIAEDFTDRYENVALTSFNSWFFVPVSGTHANDWKPFVLNTRCYTVFLVSNALPNYWRGRYNEDTDMSLQVLAAGMCTILFNAFLIDTPTTMAAPGGQMVSAAGSYQGDGRLKMARDLEREWPGVVSVKRKFRRAQHEVKSLWQKFDTPLRLKPGVKFSKEPDNYGLGIQAVKEVRSKAMRDLLEEEGLGR